MSAEPAVHRDIPEPADADPAATEFQLLEQLFVAAAGARGLPGRKIIARLKDGVMLGQALGIKREPIELLYARAHRWGTVGEHARAERLFRALCIIEAGCADHWVGLGVCLRARSLWPEAVAAFERAAALRPHWDVPHLHLLELCARRRDWTKAAAELAAFDQKTTTQTPPALKAEADRYRIAIELHLSGQSDAHHAGEAGP
ncbi:hypothetical protein XH83_13275 [Bradyrhizobium sp. CCBAU 53351]|uniref:hypothetical protein n=1 Tax=Bradyrhizobium sp. CCBAU 53351 TaxID=1325114 RepID=UPI00188950CF|nr:hypothetical protein [Bradyrhizobium sp. CCBAU 53351]QOZ76333.1 hypothetical protein XH83_13275 [Bradyrhizobium sp. CCBAU 53351]